MNAPDADRMSAWRDEVAGVLARATWPDGDTSGFPTRRVADMLADALLPLLARIDREARGEAWDEGFNAGFQIGGEAARREPCSRLFNPYRADSIAPEVTG